MEYYNQSSANEEYRRLQKLQNDVMQEMREKRDAKKNKATERAQDSKGYDYNRKYPLVGTPKKTAQMIKGKIKEKGLKKVGFGEDGLYLIIFLVSILADLATLVIGWIPIGGQLVVLTFSVVINLLYLINGHYAKTKVMMKIMVTLGFSIAELIPVISELPGFIGAFLINYALVVYSRKVDMALRKTKIGRTATGIVKVKQNLAKMNERRNEKRLEALARAGK
jgi:hypothetical protein